MSSDAVSEIVNSVQSDRNLAFPRRAEDGHRYWLVSFTQVDDQEFHIQALENHHERGL